MDSWFPPLVPKTASVGITEAVWDSERLLRFHSYALLGKVFGSALVEGSGHAAGGILDAQLSALAVLLGNVGGVVKDCLGDVVNVILRVAFTVTVFTSSVWPL